MDDKAIVHVNEPAASMSHIRSLIPNSAQLVAVDHDFHIHGIVPSVYFVVNIPESAQDSFYSGRSYVIPKDKVTQPSSALLHAAEHFKLISSDCPCSHHNE